MTVGPGRKVNFTPDNVAEFKRDRDEALRSLDEAKIRAYMRKYNVWMPEDVQTFWAAIHKARLALVTTDEQSREQSRRWLADHGFRPLP